ncbi:MAG: hypothetical protein ABI388_10835 [Bacteroidia bacterium]
MYKKQLLDNLHREIVLLKQLTPLIDEKYLNFRITEKARSTLELMQYLSGIGAVMMRWFIKNDLNPAEWEKIRAYRKTLTIQNFNERLDEQWEEIKAYMDMVTEADLMTMEVELPWKEKMMLGSAIINCPIKWLTTYRMQLFMYLKLNGKTEISTKEAWNVLA